MFGRINCFIILYNTTGWLLSKLYPTKPIWNNTKVDAVKGKGNGKAVPLQAWSGPEGSSKLRFPDFMTTAQDGGEVVSLMHWPPLPPGNTPGTHFC